VKKIVQKENKVLREKAKEVALDDISSAKIQNTISDMRESLSGEYDGVAIAAPQIAESLRIFVISKKLLEKSEGIKIENDVFINPVITKMSGDKKLMDEGCLSVRPWYGKVRRASRTIISAYNESGEKFEMEGVGLVSQVFQHETDHLDGILFTDKAKDLVEITPKEND